MLKSTLFLISTVYCILYIDIIIYIFKKPIFAPCNLFFPPELKSTYGCKLRFLKKFIPFLKNCYRWAFGSRTSHIPFFRECFLLPYNFILKQKIIYIFNICIFKKTLNKSPLKLNIQTTKCYKYI